MEKIQLESKSDLLYLEKSFSNHLSTFPSYSPSTASTLINQLFSLSLPSLQVCGEDWEVAGNGVEVETLDNGLVNAIEELAAENERLIQAIAAKKRSIPSLIAARQVNSLNSVNVNPLDFEAVKTESVDSLKESICKLKEICGGIPKVLGRLERAKLILRDESAKRQRDFDSIDENSNLNENTAPKTPKTAKYQDTKAWISVLKQ